MALPSDDARREMLARVNSLIDAAGLEAAVEVELQFLIELRNALSEIITGVVIETTAGPGGG